MPAIEEAAKEASKISRENPMIPAMFVVKAHDLKGLRHVGMTIVGGERKLLIE